MYGNLVANCYRERNTKWKALEKVMASANKKSKENKTQKIDDLIMGLSTVLHFSNMVDRMNPHILP